MRSGDDKEQRLKLADTIEKHGLCVTIAHLPSKDEDALTPAVLAWLRSHVAATPRVGLPLLYNIVCLHRQPKDEEWFKDMAELCRLADKLLYEQGYEISPYSLNEAQIKADSAAPSSTRRTACDCTSYNGGPCYNCINGAHHICDSGKRVCPAAVSATTRQSKEDAYRRAFVLLLAEVLASGWFHADPNMKAKVVAYLHTASLDQEHFTVEKVLHDAMGIPTDAERAFVAATDGGGA